MTPTLPAVRDAARRALALTDDQLLAECDQQPFRASGPGGQHRNKTESAMRLLHRPTGVGAMATERRSQHQNRGEAVARLRARLARLLVVKRRRRPTRPTQGSKERRLEGKRLASRKKAARRTTD